MSYYSAETVIALYSFNTERKFQQRLITRLCTGNYQLNIWHISNKINARNAKSKSSTDTPVITPNPSRPVPIDATMWEIIPCRRQTLRIYENETLSPQYEIYSTRTIWPGHHSIRPLRIYLSSQNVGKYTWCCPSLGCILPLVLSTLVPVLGPIQSFQILWDQEEGGSSYLGPRDSVLICNIIIICTLQQTWNMHTCI